MASNPNDPNNVPPFGGPPRPPYDDYKNQAKGVLGRLITFDELIGGTLIKVVYYIGLVMIVLTSVAMLFFGLSGARFSLLSPILGIFGAIIYLVFGTLFWRLICELWMIGFKVFDRLGEIRDRLPPR